jgi:hypothetical protein
LASAETRVVILSVPFKRLTRVLLGEPVLGALRRHADVVVVSPFSNEREFQAEFGGCGIHFVQWRPPDPIGQPLRALFAVSELLRMRGYWRRFRKERMAWNMANGYVTLGPNGDDRKMPLTTRLLLFVTSVLGLWSGAWKIPNAMIGPTLFDCPELRDLTRGYRRVTLIQSASFGIQDRMLAWMGKRERWRTVLVPYTTDQLLYNGYLMSAFNAVCVQGPIEQRFAAELHGIPFARIVRLGSAWFRHMDIVARSLKEGRCVSGTDRPLTIMFAGVSTTYFPRVSEHVLLEALMHAVDERRLAGVQVIYRPVVGDDEERRQIEAAWGGRPHLRIQLPQLSCLAMDEYGRGRMDADVSEYVSQLLDVDLVVTAGVTSLTIDAANLGIPAISAIADGTGVLRRRHNELLYDSNGRFNDLEALPIAHEVDQLVPLVEQMLADSAGAAAVAAELAAGWDYREIDFPATLLAAVMG